MLFGQYALFKLVWPWIAGSSVMSFVWFELYNAGNLPAVCTSADTAKLLAQLSGVMGILFAFHLDNAHTRYIDHLSNFQKLLSATVRYSFALSAVLDNEWVKDNTFRYGESLWKAEQVVLAVLETVLHSLRSDFDASRIGEGLTGPRGAKPDVLESIQARFEAVLGLSPKTCGSSHAELFFETLLQANTALLNETGTGGRERDPFDVFATHQETTEAVAAAFLDMEAALSEKHPVLFDALNNATLFFFMVLFPLTLIEPYGINAPLVVILPATFWFGLNAVAHNLRRPFDADGLSADIVKGRYREYRAAIRAAFSIQQNRRDPKPTITRASSARLLIY